MAELLSTLDKTTACRAEINNQFPSLWKRLIADWSLPGGEDRLWLMYSANYLLRTGGLYWAMDPVRLAHRLPGAPEMDPRRDLAPLSLIVLTHRHQDHLDLEMLRALGDLPVTWVVPESMLPLVTSILELPRSRLIVPEMLKPLEFSGLCLTPFEGLHWEEGDTPRGVPSVGYLAEFGGRRWLFPGDTRTYDASRLPDFGPLDGLVAHLWLGRSAAQLEEPPLINAFIDFCLALKPRRILLTHLNEFGRGPSDLWNESHAVRVCNALRLRAPEISAAYAGLGDCVEMG